MSPTTKGVRAPLPTACRMRQTAQPTAVTHAHMRIGEIGPRGPEKKAGETRQHRSSTAQARQQRTAAVA